MRTPKFRLHHITILIALLLAIAIVATGCPEQQRGGGGDSTGDAGDDGQNGGNGNSLLIEDRIKKVAKEVTPSVVNVRTTAERQPFEQQGQERGIGSGVIYKNNHIITNEHVVRGADEVFIALSSGRELKAKVIGTDRFSDIAVLRVQTDGLKEATFAGSDDLEVGQFAIAIGSPLGFEHTVTLGIVSALRRQVPEGGPSLSDVIQTDAPISPGNSGGALADADGKIIGINVAFIPPSTGAVSIGFAIPSSTARKVADEIIEKGRASHPFIGVEQVSLTPEVAREFDTSRDSGVVVVSVLRNSPAGKAGLKRGDIIIEMGGKEIKDSQDLFAELNKRSVGDKVQITFIRANKQQKATLTLAERSAEAQ